MTLHRKTLILLIIIAFIAGFTKLARIISLKTNGKRLKTECIKLGEYAQDWWKTPKEQGGFGWENIDYTDSTSPLRLPAIYIAENYDEFEMSNPSGILRKKGNIYSFRPILDTPTSILVAGAATKAPFYAMISVEVNVDLAGDRNDIYISREPSGSRRRPIKFLLNK
ncbi:MAG: hypothetical protein FWG98_15025 [Candidatus Cloacimonetes bacterium]|nr:hypothetical protein [Candidatus Cloacimonadota bacterium]